MLKQSEAKRRPESSLYEQLRNEYLTILKEVVFILFFKINCSFNLYFSASQPDKMLSGLLQALFKMLGSSGDSYKFSPF